MKVCVLVTGSTGSGKSTLVDSMGKHFHTVHSGDIVRKATQDDHGNNPVAPSYLNDIVKRELFDAIENHQFVVAECFPRNEEQISWIEDIREMGVAITIIRTVCPIEVRRARVVIRDHASRERLSLDISKMEKEGEDFLGRGYFGDLLDGVPHTVVDTSKSDGFVGYKGGSEVNTESVDAMINMATCVRRKWNTKVLNKGRCVDRAIEELVELQHLLQDGDSSTHMLEEVIDCLFFLFVLVGPDGLRYSGDDLFEMFCRKFCVNVHRANTGNKPHVYTLLGDC